MARGLIGAGAACKGWWTRGDTEGAKQFAGQFPDLVRFDDRRRLLDDPETEFVVIAAINSERAAFALEALEAGKDVLVDKPGCTSLDDLARIENAVAETGRKWIVFFGERLGVPSATMADRLISEGAIGDVIQTIGLGPHQLRADVRPDWFWNREQYGGILTDIAAHQFDQFLHFTRSTDAEVVSSATGRFGAHEGNGFEDFGEALIRSPHASGYARVDWFTPDGLGTWGDGRMTILGTKGYIELRKYIDIAGAPGTDHLFLVNGEAPQRIDCSGVGTPFFAQFLEDVRTREESAMRQQHAFAATRLALVAQRDAKRIGK
ncbi:Gfo/Idh/MocA family protein [Pelagibacterium xiamenense]|uniref:Gfo/Idh/MocA family protein n=1 Tax=Pelagibacterium xiamenense TaxID=2901140 RepID=UPI001E35CC88|nr:Gfo/Idh/MocA family oxidoreductase [Pelagibacterium xiamenense]MCD7059895.1 Gfo/Idh/MocA family oxidoreductase [Pelagibacterium xiamenense]